MGSVPVWMTLRHLKVMAVCVVQPFSFLFESMITVGSWSEYHQTSVILATPPIRPLMTSVLPYHVTTYHVILIESCRLLFF